MTRKSAGALYYPYIHIEDINWLRANLLLFPRVERMIPDGFTPDRDGPGVSEFTMRGEKGEEPLLSPTNLFSDRSIEAQKNLATKLRRDSANGLLQELYGKKSTRKMLEQGDYGFQINVWKLYGELRNALQDGRLAWRPPNPELYDVRGDYVEVHPQVGQAVMSTLAVACSDSGGLDIVGDYRSGALHRCLLEKDLDGIYDSWLSLERRIDPPREATGEELMDFILGIPADLSVLTPAKIREITKEEKPIEDLIEKLRGPTLVKFLVWTSVVVAINFSRTWHRMSRMIGRWTN